MKHLLLTCKKATLLIEKQQNSRLNMAENIQLRLHLLICKACQRYRKQSLLIEQWLMHSMRSGAKELSDQEIETLKQKMLNRD